MTSREVAICAWHGNGSAREISGSPSPIVHRIELWVSRVGLMLSNAHGCLQRFLSWALLPSGWRWCEQALDSSLKETRGCIAQEPWVSLFMPRSLCFPICEMGPQPDLLQLLGRLKKTSYMRPAHGSHSPSASPLVGAPQSLPRWIATRPTTLLIWSFPAKGNWARTEGGIPGFGRCRLWLWVMPP